MVIGLAPSPTPVSALIGTADIQQSHNTAYNRGMGIWCRQGTVFACLRYDTTPTSRKDSCTTQRNSYTTRLQTATG
jgi:hypothetical protein